jgi:RNA polymerase sigma-70 factor, ECF subfamily
MPSQPDDAALVRTVLAGDALAFADLYDRYVRVVRAICLSKTGQLTDADDLSQEVFLRAHRELHTLRDEARFGSWLVGIARFAAKEWQRSRRRHRYLSSSAHEVACVWSDHVATADEDANLLRLIDRLKDDEQMALHLFYLQQEPVEAARAMMGLSRSGFYRVLDRAKRRLATQFKMDANHERID